MRKTKEAKIDWISEIARESDFGFVSEDIDGERILSCQVELQGGLQNMDLRVYLGESIAVVATPTNIVPKERLDRVGELLMRLNLQVEGNFNLNYDTGAFCYILDARYDDLETPLDAEFLWLVPIATLEAWGGEIAQELGIRN